MPVDDAIKEKDNAVKSALLDQCRILQNMMEKLSLTAEEAMDIAGIPEEKRARSKKTSPQAADL